MDNRSDVREFLASRRARITPEARQTVVATPTEAPEHGLGEAGNKGEKVGNPAQAADYQGPVCFMTHLSITEGLSERQRGPETEWAGHITDAEYGSK